MDVKTVSHPTIIKMANGYMVDTNNPSTGRDYYAVSSNYVFSSFKQMSEWLEKEMDYGS